jgi:hypothetical protein
MSGFTSKITVIGLYQCQLLLLFWPLYVRFRLREWERKEDQWCERGNPLAKEFVKYISFFFV